MLTATRRERRSAHGRIAARHAAAGRVRIDVPPRSQSVVFVRSSRRRCSARATSGVVVACASHTPVTRRHALPPVPPPPPVPRALPPHLCFHWPIFAARILPPALLQAEPAVWHAARALTFGLGTVDQDEIAYTKSSALMTYLFGVEFGDCLVVLTRGDAASKRRPQVIVAVRSKLCAKYIAPLVDAVNLANAEDSSPNAAQLPMVVAVPLNGRTVAKGGDFAADDVKFKQIFASIAAAQKTGDGSGGDKTVIAVLQKEFSAAGGATGPVLGRWSEQVRVEGGGADGTGPGALTIVNGAPRG
mgnify:CR=1 FL=1